MCVCVFAVVARGVQKRLKEAAPLVICVSRVKRQCEQKKVDKSQSVLNEATDD